MSETPRLIRIAPVPPAGPDTPIDPARVLAGTPLAGVHNAFSNTRGNVHCGVWCSSAGTWSIRYTEDEFCVLLEGEAVITDVAGSARTVRAGEAFVIPAGFAGSWESRGNVRKLYAVYEEP
jgi:uncharacterized cupin superfamily protein